MGRVGRRRFWSTLPYSLVLLGLVVIVLASLSLSLQMGQADRTPADAPPRAWNATDRLVERLEKKQEVRQLDQYAYVELGGAYLQKARETGDPSYYNRSEDALLRALELEPRSASAMSLLGAVALGRHQFQEALEWAERSLEIDASHANTYGVRGDAQIELGKYPDGIESFQTMVDLKPNMDSYARVSYARELIGDMDGAIEAMQMAVAAGPPGTEPTAWARVHLGNLYFNSGRIDEAAELYQDALRDFDGYFLALAALGRAAAAQGRYNEAIELYERSVAVIPQPATLAALGDLYAKTGDMARAESQYDTVEFIAQLAAINQVVYNRELVLFYADHHRNLDQALELATRELAVRQDIYAYDALAWALYQKDRLDEAAEFIKEAMKLGTQDPNLYYHAGMIHYRLGDREVARRYLEHALDLNPHFSVLYEDHARKALAELQGRAVSPDGLGGAPS
ncbi:MAG TPA: tetratricopeptide repeat protein [Dehalococcoidia bacterium]|nr:tetratricopeptide repeat protein [Dehalococcoidia bacterium]